MGAKLIPITQGHIKSPLTVVTSRGVSLPRIAMPVANIFGVDPVRILKYDRHSLIVDARTVCASLINELTHPYHFQLGRIMGRSGSQGYNFVRRNSDMEQTDPNYREKLKAARAALGI